MGSEDVQTAGRQRRMKPARRDRDSRGVGSRNAWMHQRAMRDWNVGDTFYIIIGTVAGRIPIR